MENTIRPQQDRENPSSINLPNTNGKTNNNMNNNNSSTYNGAVEIGATPLTPRSISRSETNPYPTTFVQADTKNFKQVVQMLTGSSETVKQAAGAGTSKPNQTTQDHHHHQPAMSIPKAASSSSTSSSSIPPKKQGFKLYERRNNNQLKNSLIINTLVPGFAHNNNNSGFSPRKPEILSPSMLDFPKLALSPVTPLNEDPFDKSSSPSLGSSSEEDRAIAEKGFYLHPSPMSTPRGVEPQLLPLFPVTSPRVSGASS